MRVSETNSSDPVVLMYPVYGETRRPRPGGRPQEVSMFWFKLCFRCSGDLFHDHDQYGSFIRCMQCGFSKDVPGSQDGMLVISAEQVPPQSDETKRRRIPHGGRHFSKTLAYEADELTKPAA